MSVHASEHPHGAAFSVCIVGAGPVGIATAVELTTRGVRTILLEAGGAQARPQPPSGSPLVVPPACGQHSPDSATLARGLGGTSSRWGGRCVELDDIDFERRAFADGDGWPISHADLKPFYARARRLLSSDVAEDEAESVRQEQFDTSVEVWTRERNTARVNLQHLHTCRNLEVFVNCEVTEINFCSVSGRIRSLIVTSGGRHQQISADVFVLAAGGRGCARLLLNLQADYPTLFGGPSGPVGRYYMGHVAGEIAEVAFASRAQAERYTFRRAANGTLVRNRFQPSTCLQRSLGLLNVALWPNSSDNSRLVWGDPVRSLGYLGSRMIRRRTRPENLNAAPINDHLRNVAAHPFLAVGGAMRRVGSRYMGQVFPAQGPVSDPTNAYLLRYHSEQLPNAESRVSLAAARDRNGVRMLDTNFHFTARDYASVVSTHTALDTWLRQTGIGRLKYLVAADEREASVASQANDGFHQIGLTRMGRHRQDGVVDANGRVFDIKNLYIAGSSVFRSSGQANPTLPAVAFGVRLADHLHSVLSRQPAESVKVGAPAALHGRPVRETRAVSPC